MRKLFALCVLLGLVAAGISATHTPSVQAAPLVIIFSTPTPINNVYPADQLADLSAAVNTGYGQNGTNYGVPPTSPPDEPSIAYTKMSGIRHIRDCLSGCYDQAANYYPFFQSLCTHNSIGVIGTNVTAYLTSDLSSFTTNLPCIEGIESGNEWDVETFPNGAETGATVTAGDTTYHTSFEYQYNFMIPGSWYYMNDMVGTPEPFQFTSPVSNVIGNVASAFLYNHANPTQITRYWGNTTLARVLDVMNWYTYYSPLTRSNCAPCAIYGPSFAFPKNAQFFLGLAGGTYGPYVNVVEDHGYPSPMGYNPEGPTGDGSQSYTSGIDGPCSVNNTRYSFLYNNCSAELGAGAANPQQYAVAQPRALPYQMQTTEYSYKVVPVGSALNAHWPDAIPDDTGVKYLTRSYMLALINHRQRMYWFTLADGTDGSSSGFCTYGLLRFNTCDPSNPAYPTAGNAWPKPEMYAWNSMIQFFTDSGCKYPSCTFVPTNIKPQWSDTSLPFQTFNVEWSSGKIVLVAWLGAESYDPSSVASCHNTYACYLSVTPRSETLTVPNMTSATLQGFDTTSTDPTPAPASTTAPDGTSETIQQCAVPPVTNQFGCINTPAPLTVSNSGASNASVTFNVTDTPQWVIPVVSPAPPSPVPTATATVNPLPSGTPTSYPNPTPSPTPPAFAPINTPSPVPTATSLPNYHYISTTGSDGAAGTLTAPYATGQKCATVSTSGQHCVFLSGTYTDTTSGGVYIVLPTSGASYATPVVFQAQTCQGATLDGDSQTALEAFSFNNNVSNIVIQCLRITNFDGFGINLQGQSNGTQYANEGVQVLYNYINGNGSGVRTWYGGTNYNTIAYNWIGNNANSVCGGGAGQHGIYASGGNLYVFANIFAKNDCGWHVQIATDNATGTNVTNANYFFYFNTFGQRNNVGGSSNPGDAIVNYENNIQTSSLTFEDNLIQGGGTSAGAAVHCYSTTVLGTATISITYNMTGDTNSLTDCTGSGLTLTQNNNSTNKNLEFVGGTVAPAYFSLQSISPAINAGNAISGFMIDYYGVARPQTGYTLPAIGCCEFPQ